ncbi:MAG: hypothetical protein ACRD7E_21340 [Bryobacteraceae bacterium]
MQNTFSKFRLAQGSAAFRRGFRRAVLGAVSAAFLVATVQSAPAQMYPNGLPAEMEFTIDLAEDMAKFTEPRVAPGTEPVRGSFFVTEGNIYPAGTIPQVGGDQFDPNLPGAVGKWFCKGTFLVAGSQFDKTPMAVLTDQVLMLPEGDRALATTGTEGAGTTVRAVIGGTGAFAGYTGEQTQEFLGFNKSGGANLRVTIKLRKTRGVRFR